MLEQQGTLSPNSDSKFTLEFFHIQMLDNSITKKKKIHFYHMELSILFGNLVNNNYVGFRYPE